MASDETDQMIFLGRLGRAHGMDGEVRLFIEHFPEGTLSEGMKVCLGEGRMAQSETIASVRWSNDFAIIRFEGIEDRTPAEHLTNLDVYAPLQELPELPEGEFYRAELIGADVLLESSTDQDDGEPRRIGDVKGFLETGANDVLTVSVDSGETYNVPMIAQAVAEIDPQKHRIILKPLDQWAPEGTEF